MMELVERDFAAIKKQVSAKLSSTIRQTDAASFLRVTSARDSPYIISRETAIMDTTPGRKDLIESEFTPPDGEGTPTIM